MGDVLTSLAKAVYAPESCTSLRDSRFDTIICPLIYFNASTCTHESGFSVVAVFRSSAKGLSATVSSAGLGA
jgi:hypothetical protein